MPPARALRNRAAEPASVQDRRRARGREARADRGAEAPLAQPRSPPGRPRRPPDARGALAGALAAPLLAGRPLPRAALAVAVDLKAKIRDIPDFPKRGIAFKDIMPLLADPEARPEAVSQL